jgi:pimeloyl-ACP methyl ester carboxylesterase
METPGDVRQSIRPWAGQAAREVMLAEMGVPERRLELAGVSTAVLEGGDGPAVVVLHGPGASVVHWMWVIPDLVRTHRVVVPDLPGHGASEVLDGTLDRGGVMRWLGELIEQTCPSPPALLGHALGGAIAARFAGDHGERLGRLVLVDALGLVPFEPDPDFGRAWHDFLARPTGDTHDRIWMRCAHDLESVRRRMGDRWEPFKAYNIDRTRTPGVRSAVGALMDEFGVPAIAPADLARIAVPTALIWGRHNSAVPVRVAEAACGRYGWPLHVIEDCADDPPVEQPEALLVALRSALGSSGAASGAGRE